jgi:hypothetical protein
MAVSFAQAQAQLLSTDFLDSLGEPAQPGDVQLNEVAKTTIGAAARFALNAKNNLRQRDQVSSGKTLDSIEPTIVELGEINTVDILVAEHYKFIDKGVKGYTGQGSGPYQFKSKYPGRRMVQEIAAWLGRERRAIRNTKQAITPREQRRLNANPEARAFGVAMAVKKKGIKGSKFWTDALKVLENELANEIGQAARIDIIEQLKPE